MRYLFSLVILYSNALFSFKDSTNNGFIIKGFDFKIGGSESFNGFNHIRQVLIQSTPNSERSRFLYDSCKLISGKTTYSPMRFKLSTVLGNNKTYNFWLVHKLEYSFGLFLDIQNQNAIQQKFDSLKLVVNPSYSQFAYLTYAYQCQGVELGFQFSGKTFAKFFALFGGINSNFGMNTYKRIEMDDYYKLYNEIKEENFSAVFSSNYMHLGIKYNLSCELNMFTQAEFGINLYGQPFLTHARFYGTAFGIRYKIIDEQDRSQFRNSAFW